MTCRYINYCSSLYSNSKIGDMYQYSLYNSNSTQIYNMLCVNIYGRKLCLPKKVFDIYFIDLIEQRKQKLDKLNEM